MTLALRIAVCLIAAWLGLPTGFADRARAEETPPGVELARKQWLAGKYEQAAETLAPLVAEHPAAAIGLARVKVGTGQRDEAATLLAESMERHPRTAILSAEAAHVALSRGDLAKSQEYVDAALALDADQLLARFVQAELHRTAGRLDEATAAYKWFVDYYNGRDVRDAEALDLVGQAAAQFARWSRLSDQFRFLVNELYPDALAADAAWWPAHYRAGLLYLEKYNEAEASRELKAALALNPAAAEVHAALARLSLRNYDLDAARRAVDRAREINPQLLAGQLARGDILLANFQAEEAIAAFEEAVRMHPASEEAQGRLAAAFAIVDGLPDDLTGTRVGKLIDAAVARNARCGEFFASLAGALDQSRRFPAAARFYREAIERMPQLVEPHGELGLVAMRLGEEVEAARLLAQAFEIDPFNVRVSNTLKVLEVLDGYAVIETEHFVIRFDRGADEILAQYAARYLEEEVYPELCAKFGFEPQGKSLFEFFSRARNTSGHGWFSARMVGLPFVHTVGACAGKVVALASPNDMPKKYNWARVLKHEFVHVLNLQQTNFNVPHWYTEALAVGSEGYPRPQIWNDLLRTRVPKGELFNLDTINLGFVRPQSSNDWQMAYCQADLYAQYLVERFGDQALARLLVAYRDNLDTRAALAREFDVEQEEFERGYVEFVRRVTSELQGAAPAEPSESLAALQKAHQAQPDDALVAARLAVAHLARRDYPQARKLAELVLQDAAAENVAARQLAAYVLARVRMVVGENRAALALLETHLDREQPDARLLNLLAGLKLKSENYAEAAELYRLGADRNPRDATWLKSLARVYLAQANEAQLADVLARLAPLDTDDVVIRKKLAQLALARSDFDAAAHWAREALYVDVTDAEIHRMLGDAHSGREEFARAADEYEVAVKLASGDAALHLALAEACLRAERPDRARTAVARALELDPGNEQAAALAARLDK